LAAECWVRKVLVLFRTAEVKRGSEVYCGEVDGWEGGEVRVMVVISVWGEVVMGGGRARRIRRVVVEGDWKYSILIYIIYTGT
jgi:hypothetical protein